MCEGDRLVEILSADQEYRDALVSPAKLLPAGMAYLVATPSTR
jgi:hypothetical protein